MLRQVPKLGAGVDFAAAGVHVRCIRLSVADFVRSAPYGASILSVVNDKGKGGSNSEEPESSVKLSMIKSCVH